jgi:hemoglobin-like flavoprotein
MLTPDMKRIILAFASSFLRSSRTKHVDYGVKAAHYPALGAALMGALQSRLGDEWNAETAAAWSRVFQLLSKHMIEEAYAGRDRPGVSHVTG